MTKDRTTIKRAYWSCHVGYEDSLDALVAMGMTEGAADDYLFVKDADRTAGEQEGDDRIAKATAVFGSAKAAIDRV